MSKARFIIALILLLAAECLAFAFGLKLASDLKSFALITAQNKITAQALPFMKAQVRVFFDQNLLTDNTVIQGSAIDIPFDTSRDGKYQIEYRTGGLRFKKEFYMDTTAPIITVSSIPATNQENLPVNITTNESATLYLVSHEGNAIPLEVDGTALLKLKDGTNRFIVTATDQFENMSMEEFSIIKDTKGPEINLEFPQTTIYLNDTVLIFSLQDATKVKSVQVNGVEITPTADNKYSVPIKLNAGSNQLVITAEDELGNVTSLNEVLDFKLEQPKRIPILMYHHITTEKPETNAVSNELFDGQLKWIKQNGYTTISFKDLNAHYLQGLPVPEKPVILSFDDGYLDNYINAFRILKDNGMVGSFAIIPSLVGSTQWGQRTYMNWEEIKELTANDMEIISHTQYHPSLPSKSDADLEKEFKWSKDEIKAQTGQDTETLVYPSGDYDDRVIEALKKYGYKSARTNKNVSTSTPANIYKLPIVRVSWGNSPQKIGNQIVNMSK